jgi:MFS superfamily sulfate permease-like transporter
VAPVPPGVRAPAGYRRGWLVKDLVAGVVLTTLLVPQGDGLRGTGGTAADHGAVHDDHVPARLCGVGPSRILVLGPDSSLGPMIAATILPLVVAGGDPARAVA